MRSLTLQRVVRKTLFHLAIHLIDVGVAALLQKKHIPAIIQFDSVKKHACENKKLHILTLHTRILDSETISITFFTPSVSFVSNNCIYVKKRILFSSDTTDT